MRERMGLKDEWCFWRVVKWDFELWGNLSENEVRIVVDCYKLYLEF